MILQIFFLKKSFFINVYHFHNVYSRGVRYPVPSNFYDYEDEDDTLWYKLTSIIISLVIRLFIKICIISKVHWERLLNREV